MARVAGADGCKAGWICLIRDDRADTVESTVASTAADLLTTAADLDILAIDIPIGLPDQGRRECDVLARKLLSPRRHRSVFPAPVRAALKARTQQKASEITSRLNARRVSAQAWGIYSKIMEVDRELRRRPELRNIVREVHPEVSFREWNGSQPMEASKKTLDGMMARLELVQQHFGESAFRDVRDAWRHGVVGDDDILDAFAALWTAERIARGRAVALPAEPPLDSEGLRMAIVY